MIADRPYHLIHADALAGLRQLPDGHANCAVTSPPYWGLRDYKVDGQLGLEAHPDEYVARLVEIFGELRRVLDPFCGSGTAGVVALSHGREFVGIDLNAEYLGIAERRIRAEVGGLQTVIV